MLLNSLIIVGEHPVVFRLLFFRVYVVLVRYVYVHFYALIQVHTTLVHSKVQRLYTMYSNLGQHKPDWGCFNMHRAIDVHQLTIHFYYIPTLITKLIVRRCVRSLFDSVQFVIHQDVKKKNVR